MAARLLVVDERGSLAERVDAALRRHFDVVRASTLDEVRGRRFEVAVIARGATNQSALCRAIVSSGLAPRVVFLGQDPSLEEAVLAMHAWASDFIPDGDDPEAVVSRVVELAEQAEIQAELRRLRGAPRHSAPFADWLGESLPMLELRDRLGRIASSDQPVLLVGEAGTGKEHLAQLLHTNGLRSGGPFVAVRGDLTPLAEDGERVRAVSNPSEPFEQAAGGTLFLHEITDMPLDVQLAVLQALRQGSLAPLGGRSESALDVRMIASSSRDLEQAVSSGRLRRDLYSYLSTSVVRLPALRERSWDVLLLAHRLIARERTANKPVLGITPAAARALVAYGWPGNIRELEDCIRQALATTRYDHITLADLPPQVRGDIASARGEPSLGALGEVERAHILRVLRAVGGNKSAASRFLGLDRKTLYRKLKAFREEPAPQSPRPPRARADSHPDG